MDSMIFDGDEHTVQPILLQSRRVPIRTVFTDSMREEERRKRMTEGYVRPDKAISAEESKS